jgi:type I restriction enzyme S subunit
MSQFIEMFGNPLFNTKKWKWYSNINNVVTIVLGSTPNTKEPKYWDGDIKWVTPAEMDDETFMINDTLRHITEFGVKSANLTKLPIGSVLFSTRAPIGKVGIAAAEMYCNQGFKSFICSNQVDSIFLYYTLKLNKEYLCSLGTGTTFKELSKKTVEGLKLGVPPIDLQKQFAIIYKQADKSKFGDFKSQFIEMFKNIPSVKIADCCITVSGGTPNTKKIEYYDGGDIPWLSSGEINQGYIFSTDKYITQLGLENSSAKWVPANSVVIAMYGATAGKVGFIKIPLTTNQAVCTLLPNDGFEPLYLYYATLSKTSWMISQCRGAAQPNISQSIIRSMEIPMATIDEQKRFCKLLTQADKSKSYVWTALKNLESMLGYYIRQVA